MSVESAELLRQENEKKILQTVKALLNEYKPSEISIGKIASRAGVTAKTVNNIFGTKNSLFLLTAISAYKEERAMLDELVTSSEFAEKSGLEQVMTLHYERVKFQRKYPYVVSTISEIERLRLNSETEINQCNQYMALAAIISSYYDAPIKKGQMDGSVKENMNLEDIRPLLFFSFGAVTHRLQTLSLNALMSQRVDSQAVLRTVLKMTKDYIGT